MKRSKKYVALLLCLAMLLGMMPAMALILLGLSLYRKGKGAKA